MTEQQYADQWRKDAFNEGHRKRHPRQVLTNDYTTKYPSEVSRLLALIADGVATKAQLAKTTGYSVQFVDDRLRYLKKQNKIVYIEYKWSIVS